MEETRPRLTGSHLRRSGKLCVLVRLVHTLCFLLPLARGPLALAADSGQPKNVLVLYSFSDRGVWDSIDSLESAVRARAGPVNFYVEYLETQRFEDETYENSFADTVRRAFGGRGWTLSCGCLPGAAVRIKPPR